MIDDRTLQSELLHCPDDANGDFAAIGDENHTKRKRTDHRAPQMPNVSMIVRSRAVCVTRSWPLPLTCRQARCSIAHKITSRKTFGFPSGLTATALTHLSQ